MSGSSFVQRRFVRAAARDDHARFEQLIDDWPEDIRAHVMRVLEDSLAPGAELDD